MKARPGTAGTATTAPISATSTETSLTSIAGHDGEGVLDLDARRLGGHGRERPYGELRLSQQVRGRAHGLLQGTRLPGDGVCKAAHRPGRAARRARIFPGDRAARAHHRDA